MPTTPIPAGGSERGFSLTEILVVVVIIGFTALVSIPNFMRMRVVYNNQAALREVAGTHERARLEALKRHSQVGVTYNRVTGGSTIEKWMGTTWSKERRDCPLPDAVNLAPKEIVWPKLTA